MMPSSRLLHIDSPGLGSTAFKWQKSPPAVFQWVLGIYWVALTVVVLKATLSPMEDCGLMEHFFGCKVANRISWVSTYFFVAALIAVLHERIDFFKSLSVLIKLTMGTCIALFILYKLPTTAVEMFTSFVSPLLGLYWFLFQGVVLLEYGHVLGKCVLAKYGDCRIAMLLDSSSRRISSSNSNNITGSINCLEQQQQSWSCFISLGILYAAPFITISILKSIMDGTNNNSNSNHEKSDDLLWMDWTLFACGIIYLLCIWNTIRKGWTVAATVSLYLGVLAALICLTVDEGGAQTAFLSSVHTSKRLFLAAVLIGVILVISNLIAFNVFKTNITWRRITTGGFSKLLRSRGVVNAITKCDISSALAPRTCDCFTCHDHYRGKGPDRKVSIVHSNWGNDAGVEDNAAYVHTGDESCGGRGMSQREDEVVSASGTALNTNIGGFRDATKMAAVSGANHMTLDNDMADDDDDIEEEGVGSAFYQSDTGEVATTSLLLSNDTGATNASSSQPSNLLGGIQRLFRSSSAGGNISLSSGTTVVAGGGGYISMSASNSAHTLPIDTGRASGVSAGLQMQIMQSSGYLAAPVSPVRNSGATSRIISSPFKVPSSGVSGMNDALNTSSNVNSGASNRAADSIIGNKFVMDRYHMQSALDSGSDAGGWDSTSGPSSFEESDFMGGTHSVKPVRKKDLVDTSPSIALAFLSFIGFMHTMLLALFTQVVGTASWSDADPTANTASINCLEEVVSVCSTFFLGTSSYLSEHRSRIHTVLILSWCGTILLFCVSSWSTYQRTLWRRVRQERTYLRRYAPPQPVSVIVPEAIISRQSAAHIESFTTTEASSLLNMDKQGSTVV